MSRVVEVFKTNVICSKQAKLLATKLLQLFPGSRVNFDLDDCDNILRIEGFNICCEKIRLLLNREGYECLDLA